MGFLTGWNFAALLITGSFIFGIMAKLKMVFPAFFKRPLVNRFKPTYAIIAGVVICLLPGILEGELPIPLKIFLGANAGLYSHFFNSVLRKFIRNQVATNYIKANDYNENEEDFISSRE